MGVVPEKNKPVCVALFLKKGLKIGGFKYE